jgi:hypothetical protein
LAVEASSAGSLIIVELRCSNQDGVAVIDADAEFAAAV